MEIPWTHIIWLVVAVSVYLFGIWEGRGQGYKKRVAEESQEQKENPPPEPPQPAPPVTVKVDDPGLMRIKNENGLLTLDLDGARVNPAALTIDQRKRLIEMLNVIRPWLEGRAAPAPAPAPAASLPPSPAPVTTTPTPSIPRATAPIPSTPREKDAPPPATGIVGQIDAILQARLHGTPLEGRGIFLSNSPEGGVIVNVGLKKFNGVEEVTDPEIKAALRAAITEWENKYTPGL
jgi:hypothetical protein